MVENVNWKALRPIRGWEKSFWEKTPASWGLGEWALIYCRHLLTGCLGQEAPPPQPHPQPFVSSLAKQGVWSK